MLFPDKKTRNGVYTDVADKVLGVRTEEVIHIPKITGAQDAKTGGRCLSGHLDNIVTHRPGTNRC